VSRIVELKKKSPLKLKTVFDTRTGGGTGGKKPLEQGGEAPLARQGEKETRKEKPVFKRLPTNY